MQPQRSVYLWIGAGILAIAALGAFFLFRAGPPGTSQGVNATSTGVESTGGGVTVVGSGPVAVVPVSAPAAPNHRRPLTFGASMPSEVRTALREQFDVTVAAIDKKSTDFAAWINLGILRKTTGDYAGAEEAWKYVIAVYPENQIAFNNLGGLYLDFIKDYPKAEANFKKAIAIEPTDINAYVQLYSLYTVYGYKAGTSAAADILAQGLKNNPNNQTLLELQRQGR